MENVNTSAAPSIMDEFYDEEFVRNFFGHKTLGSLRSMRARAADGTHPPTMRFGKQVKYPKAAFHEWVSNQPLRGAVKRK